METELIFSNKYYHESNPIINIKKEEVNNKTRNSKYFSLNRYLLIYAIFQILFWALGDKIWAKVDILPTFTAP